MNVYVATNPAPPTDSSDLKNNVNARVELVITGGVDVPQYFPIGCEVFSKFTTLS